MLLRGGPRELFDLCAAADLCSRAYALDGEPFFALSLTAVLNGEDEAAVLGALPLVAYAYVHRMSAAHLAKAGIPVWATFKNPRHFSAQLTDASERSILAFLAVAGPLRDNPHHRAQE